jgi:Family of unknown function (DUF5317)
MFVLYAVAAGLLIGLLVGGRLSGLARLQFEWAPLIALGMAIQLALFSDPIASSIGTAGPPIYVGSSLLVLAAVCRNWSITGLPIVALGAASNLAAIVANGGYMPASAAALAAQGRDAPSAYSNSTYLADPALAPLTDIFAMPTWIPLANVFSIGDILIAVGIALAIVAAMRRGATDERRASPGRGDIAIGDGASRN